MSPAACGVEMRLQPSTAGIMQQKQHSEISRLAWLESADTLFGPLRGSVKL